LLIAVFADRLEEIWEWKRPTNNLPPLIDFDPLGL
jgi:hypothetical protein